MTQRRTQSIGLRSFPHFVMKHFIKSYKYYKKIIIHPCTIQKNKLLGDSLAWVLFPGSPSSRGIDAGKHVLTFMHTLDKTVRVQE